MTDPATNISEGATATSSEYLAGVAWGRFARDGEVSLLNATIREHEAEISRLRRAVAFARSAIKSGEPWTDTCEQELRL